MRIKIILFVILLLTFNVNIVFSEDLKIPGEIKGLKSLTHVPNQKSKETTITFEWDKPDDNTSFLSWVLDNNKNTIPDITPETNLGEVPTKVTLQIPSDGRWYFHIRGVGPNGEGGPVSTIGYFDIDTTPPGKVTNLQASLTADNYIKLSLTTPGNNDLAKIIIRYSTITNPTGVDDGNLLIEDTNVKPGEDKTYTQTQIENGKTYYYTVFACDDVENCGVGETASVHVSIAGNSAPVIDNFSCTPTNIKTGDNVSCIIVAHDNDGDNITASIDFNYESNNYTEDNVSESKIGYLNENFINKFTTKGSYKIIAKVTDGKEEVYSDVITIKVTKPSSQSGGTSSGVGGGGGGGGAPPQEEKKEEKKQEEKADYSKLEKGKIIENKEIEGEVKGEVELPDITKFKITEVITKLKELPELKNVKLKPKDGKIKIEKVILKDAEFEVKDINEIEFGKGVIFNKGTIENLLSRVKKPVSVKGILPEVDLKTTKLKISFKPVSANFPILVDENENFKSAVDIVNDTVKELGVNISSKVKNGIIEFDLGNAKFSGVLKDIEFIGNNFSANGKVNILKDGKIEVIKDNIKVVISPMPYNVEEIDKLFKSYEDVLNGFASEIDEDGVLKASWKDNGKNIKVALCFSGVVYKGSKNQNNMKLEMEGDKLKAVYSDGSYEYWSPYFIGLKEIEELLDKMSEIDSWKFDRNTGIIELVKNGVTFKVKADIVYRDLTDEEKEKVNKSKDKIVVTSDGLILTPEGAQKFIVLQ